MQGATITLANPQADDLLTVGGLPAGISVDGASTATSIILTGATSLADYQAALQQVFYQNTGETPDPADRTIDVTVNDGIAASNIAVATIAIDRAPDAAPDSAVTSEGTAVITGNVLANDELGDTPTRNALSGAWLNALITTK